MKLSQNLKMDIVSNQTKPTLNLLQTSQNKSDLDEESQTLQMDIVSNQTKPNFTKQTLILL